MIDEKMWKKYEEIRASGVTNMFDVKAVSDLSGLKSEEIKYIMLNYSNLRDEFEVVE